VQATLQKKEVASAACPRLHEDGYLRCALQGLLSDILFCFIVLLQCVIHNVATLWPTRERKVRLNARCKYGQGAPVVKLYFKKAKQFLRFKASRFYDNSNGETQSEWRWDAHPPTPTAKTRIGYSVCVCKALPFLEKSHRGYTG
jgi:hypothetical protein